MAPHKTGRGRFAYTLHHDIPFPPVIRSLLPWTIWHLNRHLVHSSFGASDPQSRTASGSSLPFFLSKIHGRYQRTDGQTDRTNRELDLYQQTAYAIS